MSKIVIFLAEGFEEIEGIAVIDALRRAGEDITTVAIDRGKVVQGAHGIKVYADTVLDEVDLSSFDAVVLPGGMPGTTNLEECYAVLKTVREFFDEGKLVAAICAAPIVLGRAGILEGKKATVYPGFEGKLTGAKYVKNKIIVDKNIITAPGPGRALDFAFEIVKYLQNERAALNLRADMIC